MFLNFVRHTQTLPSLARRSTRRRNEIRVFRPKPGIIDNTSGWILLVVGLCAF